MQAMPIGHSKIESFCLRLMEYLYTPHIYGIVTDFLIVKMYGIELTCNSEFYCIVCPCIVKKFVYSYLVASFQTIVWND